MKTKRKIAWGRLLICLLILGLLTAAAFVGIRLWKIYHGEIIANIPDPEKYPVEGVDVSRYQGNIDWDAFAGQDVRFAFIKATEGSNYQDPCFSYNWEAAEASGIYAGAYHFFSYESSGSTQAENFIQTVGSLEGKLPPVVDLEFYGDYSVTPLSKKETRQILDELLDALEAHYGIKPIIYTTTRAYYSYLFGGGYGEYPLWMRNTYMEPHVSWCFWQYSDKGTLEGYDGMQDDKTENFIDLNVYHGTMDEFLTEFGLAPEEETTE